jgi:bifunctional pyridoxal-dependent enzyme with beta-cystathionase and maltose regulon repressor activities
MSILLKKIALAPDIVVQQIDKDLVLLNMNTEHYYGLDPVGSHFWQLIAENNNTSAAIDLLLLEYEVDRNRLENDIERLVTALSNAQLIILSDD